MYSNKNNVDIYCIIYSQLHYSLSYEFQSRNLFHLRFSSIWFLSHIVYFYKSVYFYPNIHGQIDMNAPFSWTIIIIMFQLLMVGLFLVTTSFYRAQTRNLMINGLRLDDNIRFRSELSGLGWLGLLCKMRF